MSLSKLIRDDVLKNGVTSIIEELIAVQEFEAQNIVINGIDDGFDVTEIESFSGYVEAKYKYDVLVEVAEALDIGVAFGLKDKLEVLIKNLEKMKEGL